ncbi:Vesicle-associated membrane protein, partial [Kappamyces sp. JEL0680]
IRTAFEEQVLGGSTVSVPDLVHSHSQELAQFHTTLAAIAAEHSLHQDDANSIKNVQSQVDEVRSLMAANIEKVLARGERIDNLVERSGELQEQSMQFRTASRTLHKSMWRKNIKVHVTLAVILVLVVVLVSVAFK